MAHSHSNAIFSCRISSSFLFALLFFSSFISFLLSKTIRYVQHHPSYLPYQPTSTRYQYSTTVIIQRPPSSQTHNKQQTTNNINQSIIPLFIIHHSFVLSTILYLLSSVLYALTGKFHECYGLKSSPINVTPRVC